MFFEVLYLEKNIGGTHLNKPDIALHRLKVIVLGPIYENLDFIEFGQVECPSGKVSMFGNRALDRSGDGALAGRM